MKKKRKTTKKKTNRTKKILNGLLIVFLSGLLLIFIAGVSFLTYIIFTTDQFNPNNLYQKESTRIYFADGELISTIGSEKREKITYDQLSETLIDALVATEDSRFFQHNGFNGARFLKATFQQLMGDSSAGGASTITMQVSKNNFTSTEASGIEGIIRKFRDIYISVFQIEKSYTKEEILEFYVNFPFLGSGAYGVQQASEIYFGKDASELSLPEASLIAGLLQAPGAYDPYSYPENAEERRSTVLSLMVRHGYITEDEKEAAEKISVESLLVNDSSIQVSKYQVLLDTVIMDIRTETGNDPYNIPMDIYTTFDKDKQDVINDFYKNYKFADKKIQVGIGVIDNDNGALLAVGGGRSKTKELSFNYATQIKRHIGSTAKPVFDYGPAIEHLKWSTYTPVFDERTTYGSGQVMNNWDYGYQGMISLKDGLAQSRNTTALQTFQAVPNSKIKEFVLGLGMTPEIDKNGFIHEAHAVGAFTGTSPVQLASAFSAFANGGYYTKAYSYTKIIYRESGKEVEKEVQRVKAMSESTAYMISWILLGVTPSNNVSGTQISTKTGTSSYEPSALKAAGVSYAAIQDSWVATYSPDYTISFWCGYDKLIKGYYMTLNGSFVERNKIQKILMDDIMKKNSKFTKPSSVISSRVELETFPAMLPSENTPSSLIRTHLFVKGTQPAEKSSRFSKLNAPSNLNAHIVGTTVTASWEAANYPEAIDEQYLNTFFKENYSKWASKYLSRRLSYNKSNIGDFGYLVYLESETGDLKYIGFTKDVSLTFNAPLGSYKKVVVKSAYSIFKRNASNTISTPINLSAECIYTLVFKNDESSVISWDLALNGNYIESSLPVKGLCNTSDVTLDSTFTKELNSTTYGGNETITISTPGTYIITYKMTILGIEKIITRTINIT